MVVIIITISANAQRFSLKDDFETNANGWTEIVDRDGESIIIDGVLRIKSKKIDGFYESHCFTDMDVTSNFEIKCEVKVKYINYNGIFGMILDYLDDGNFIAFIISEENAHLHKYKDGKLVGSISNGIKLKSERNANVELSVKNTFQKLSFEVNGMRAIEARFVPLTSTGIGFYVAGEQTVLFDNFEIIQ